MAFNTFTIKHILMMSLVVACLARHTPYRNYNVDWLALIEDPEQLRDARVFYTFFKNNMKKELQKGQEKNGFNSEETIFEGFHHPFFYSQSNPDANILDMENPM